MITLQRWPSQTSTCRRWPSLLLKHVTISRTEKGTVGLIVLCFALNILRSVIYHNTPNRYIVHIIILGHRESLSFIIFNFITETGSGAISLDLKFWYKQICFLFQIRKKLVSKQMIIEKSEKAKKLREQRKFGKKVGVCILRWLFGYRNSNKSWDTV